MEQKTIIYISIASILCLLGVFYFYKSSSPVDIDQDMEDANFTLSKGALEQASRVPSQETKKNLPLILEDPEEEINLDDYDREDIDEFLNKHYPSPNADYLWQAVQDDSGQITGWVGDGDVSSSDGIWGWAKELAPLFGVTPNQIAQPQVSDAGTIGTNYYLQQVVNGYEVYGAALQVFVNKQTGRVYQINDHLREVREFDTTIQVSREEARQKAIDHFQGDSPQEINPSKYPNPQLYVGRDNSQQLGWIFDIKTDNNVMNVIVGAIDGQILFSQGTRIFH